MPFSQHTLFRGRIITLENERSYVELSSVGASLNRFVVDGENHVVPSSLEEPIFGYRGVIVAPWPNRLGDGVYSFDGEEFEVPVNELEKRNALHGLVSFEDFTVGQHDAHAVEFIHRIVPTLGYPFPLELRVRYSLEDTRLSTEVTAINLGRRDAPYGVCPHPYLVAGDGTVNDCSLRVPAGSYLEVDERQLPVSVHPVSENPDIDFNEERLLGSTAVDYAFTDLHEGTVRLTGPSGRATSLEFDPAELPWVQVYTADHPDPERNRAGVAVEPMTCPPDAFRTGEGVIRLRGGNSHSVSWSIVAHPAEG